MTKQTEDMTDIKVFPSLTQTQEREEEIKKESYLLVCSGSCVNRSLVSNDSFFFLLSLLSSFLFQLN